jgi:hypothetical protein
MTPIDLEIHAMISLMLTGLLLYVLFPINSVRLWFLVFLFFFVVTLVLY